MTDKKQTEDGEDVEVYDGPPDYSGRQTTPDGKQDDDA